MNNIITAQELKTKGASFLNKLSKKNDETFISIRGEKRFVVLTVEQYAYLKECELDSAWKEVKEDLKAGRYSIKSVDDHINDLKNV